LDAHPPTRRSGSRGPKDFDVLPRSTATSRERSDFGMFAVIVVPLLRSLKWVNATSATTAGDHHPHVHHQRDPLPLRHKSVVSMRKMQENPAE